MEKEGFIFIVLNTKNFIFNILVLIIGGLLGCLVYYLLNIDLGKMIVAQDLNLQEIFFHNLIYFFSAIFGFLTLGLLNIGMLLINSGMLGFL